MKRIIEKYNSVNLILRIAIGIVIGAALAFALPQATWIGMFGTLFVGSLKAIAPVLVAILVASSSWAATAWRPTAISPTRSAPAASPSSRSITESRFTAAPLPPAST